MPISRCANCESEFSYDLQAGLNIAYFPAESTKTHYFGGGDFPCCPLCLKKCAREEIPLTRADIKSAKKWFPK